MSIFADTRNSIGSNDASPSLTSPTNRRSSRGIVECVSSNHFASLVKVHVKKQLINSEIQFTNTRNPSRIIVTSVSELSKDSGVKEDDVVVAYAGRALQRRHKVKDLDSMKQYEQGDKVTMLLWGLRGLHSLYGAQFAIHHQDNRVKIEIAEIPAPQCFALDGTVIAVIDRNPSELRALQQLGIERGDIIIGINYEPVPDDETPKAVLKRLQDHLMLGPAIINTYRCTDQDGHNHLVRAAIRAARTRLAQEGGLYGTAASVQLQTEYCVHDCTSMCTFSSTGASSNDASFQQHPSQAQ
mmetsp:Transcript_7835/g.11887  ORF Transcript_7835/g.11887 Transcript_7835/m.11887 type:complete len:298 (-) Transcript_7835:387-1280(-)|eukprot:CAMPEP_0197314150 /NCGR_PEP_ID=MMETSP0891-20130614/32412_1 /TAXON_ID=44058 ORGANISM="Aureoumbra lagunensis, Strain CCMP1510" /NCGR_SAMPLE_ID=MMETSP0891 /ASSEMBLY_ACC=CAM_ASM_000534 /LENGTH=297 /DNA_ID=CAMNT_0042802441 /DNA_START=36 /DNA_END=929 /DNA_ORIENTATION=-